METFYFTALYASLISDTKQVSAFLSVGCVGGCTGCFTKKLTQTCKTY